MAPDLVGIPLCPDERISLFGLMYDLKKSMHYNMTSEDMASIGVKLDC